MESQNNFHLGLWATCIVAYLKTARNCEMANLDLLPENEADFFFTVHWYRNKMF